MLCWYDTLSDALATAASLNREVEKLFTGATRFMDQLRGSLALTIQRGYCNERMAEGDLTPFQGNFKDLRPDATFIMDYYGFSATQRIENSIPNADETEGTIVYGPIVNNLTRFCEVHHPYCGLKTCPHYCKPGNAALYNNSVRNAEMCLMRMIENDMKYYIDTIAAAPLGSVLKILTMHAFTPNGYASGYPLLPGES